MPHSDLPSATRSRVTVIFAIGALVTLGLVAAMALAIGRMEQRKALENWRLRLQSTAIERARALDRILAEYVSDAVSFSEYPVVQSSASHRGDTILVGARRVFVADLLRRMADIHGQENVWVLDKQEQLTASASPADPAVLPWLKRIADSVLATSTYQIVQDDLSSARSHTYVGTPILSRGRPIGVLVLSVHTAEWILPAVTPQWHESRTAEVLLLEQPPDRETRPLSGLRKGFSSADRVRLAPISQATVADMLSVGRLGEFTDYSGDRVIASARRVKAAPWLVVAKIDRKEALLEAWQEALEIAALLFGLGAAAVGVAYGLIARFRAERAVAEIREKELTEAADHRYAVLNARTKALLDANVVGITIGTEEGAILEANDYYLNLVGYSRAELGQGRVRWIDITPEEHLWKDLHSIRELRERGSSTPYEKQYIRKTGERVWVMVGDTLLNNEDGKILSFIVDMEAHKLLEAQYQQAQKMEAVGRLAGGVAHDFNNVLTAIKGIATLALEDVPVADSLHKDLREIDEYADRATALTRQLLAFSRQQVLQPRVIDAVALVNGLERMLRRLIGEDVALEMFFDQAPLMLRADPAQVEQVIVNLIVNARDAMPHGGRLFVSVRRRAAADNPDNESRPSKTCVAVEVRDTGEGMSPEVLAHVFEPFFTTKPQGKGTGLGLATVYGIVRQSGGTIQVTSEPGTGTSFTIFFPEVEERPVPAPTVPMKVAPRARRAVVLLVEDDEAVRSLARRTLERRGHRVLVARSGLEALALAQRQMAQVDVVLTDLVMPGMSGQELGRNLRAVHGPKPIIFMSGYSAEVVTENEQLEGWFLEKPFTPPQLIALVEDVISAVVPAGNLS